MSNVTSKLISDPLLLLMLFPSVYNGTLLLQNNLLFSLHVLSKYYLKCDTRDTFF